MKNRNLNGVVDNDEMPLYAKLNIFIKLYFVFPNRRLLCSNLTLDVLKPKFGTIPLIKMFVSVYCNSALRAFPPRSLKSA